MNHWIRRIAIAGLMLGATAGVIACSDDDGDELTLEQYFAAVDTIDNETTEQIDASFEALPEEPTIEQVREAFSALPAALDEAVADLEDINPPDEVADNHDALVDALTEFADEAQSSADAAADATTVDEYFTTVETESFSAADEAFTAACLDLQQVAADNSITVDLGCEDEDDNASAAAEQAVQNAAAAWNAKDVEAFAVLFTDNGLSAAFAEGEPLPREEILAGLAEEIGSGALEINEIASEPTEAGADVTVLWVSGKVLEHFRFSLVDDAGAWKIDGQETLPVEPPAGATVVDIDLNEFAFGFGAAQITSDAGTLVLQGNNVGTQEHHLIFAKIPEDANLEELLMSEEDVPGFEFIGGSEPAAPGAKATLVLAAPLEPGRYTFVCFLPDTTDPEGTPHAFKGMTADFMVQ